MVDADNGQEVDGGQINHSISKVEGGQADNHDLEHEFDEGFVAREVGGQLVAGGLEDVALLYL